MSQSFENIPVRENESLLQVSLQELQFPAQDHNLYKLDRQMYSSGSNQH